MGLGVGSAALVTGAGSGVGRAISLALAKRGVTVTVVEYWEPDGQETVRLIEAESAQLPEKPRAPPATFIKCDVTVPEQLVNAFLVHERTYGRLDVLVNNAGIGDDGKFWDDLSWDGKGQWRKVLDVNLSAVIDGTRLGIQLMRRTGQPGVIINMALAKGLYPSANAPIYSASKGGVVLLTRSLAGLKSEGIRVNAFCPEHIQTKLTRSLPRHFIEDGYIPMDKILKGVFELMEDETQAGSCLWVTNRRGAEYWPTPQEKAKYEVSPKEHPKDESNTELHTPTSPREYRRVVIQTLADTFRAASRIVTLTFRTPVKPGHVLVKYLYAGVNAINLKPRAESCVPSGGGVHLPPLAAGFEAVGIVAEIGAGAETADLRLGSPVAVISSGGFSEFGEVNQKYVSQVPVATPEILAIITSGLTASMSLEESGKMRYGETVLVTAAAGETGQFAVQLAKLAGNKVVATCGGEEEASLLRSLGVDRVIDLQKEAVKYVLNTEFPGGIDLIYDSVGGEMFKTCLNALARYGRIIVNGTVSQYHGEEGWEEEITCSGLQETNSAESQSEVGFFLTDYTRGWREHLHRLTKLYLNNKLKVAVDPKPFVGLESVADAEEYFHSGLSVGKVVVQVEAPAIKEARLVNAIRRQNIFMEPITR